MLWLAAKWYALLIASSLLGIAFLAAWDRRNWLPRFKRDNNNKAPSLAARPPDPAPLPEAGPERASTPTRPSRTDLNLRTIQAPSG